MISSTIALIMTALLRCLKSPLGLLSRLLWKRSQSNCNDSKFYSPVVKYLDRIPSNSWDSHMHVVNPVEYPLANNAQYVPKPHPLLEALNFESSVYLRNIVLVQPSIYGYDNSCMLDALRTLGPQRGRAVVAFDPRKINFSTLQEWHRLGVRGVRLNLHSIGKTLDANQLDSTLREYADIIRPLNWVLQLYVSMSTVTVLEKIVPQLGVRVCLDHFAQPILSESGSSYSTTGDPYLLSGFGSLVNLLEHTDTYVKLSAPYRISKNADLSDLEPVAKELLRVAGKTKIVFATDWPHTRFEGLDIRPYIEQVLNWCGEDQILIDRLFKYNAEELWDARLSLKER